MIRKIGNEAFQTRLLDERSLDQLVEFSSSLDSKQFVELSDRLSEHTGTVNSKTPGNHSGEVECTSKPGGHAQTGEKKRSSGQLSYNSVWTY